MQFKFIPHLTFAYVKCLDIFLNIVATYFFILLTISLNRTYIPICISSSYLCLQLQDEHRLGFSALIYQELLKEPHLILVIKVIILYQCPYQVVKELLILLLTLFGPQLALQATLPLGQALEFANLMAFAMVTIV